MKPRPADLMRPAVLAQPAYAVEEAQGLLKLDAMENPFAWPGELQAAWLQALQGVTLNRYPDPGAQALQQVLREAQAIPETAGCLLGNGSDELIQMLVLAVQGSGRPVLAPVPTFVMYEVVARALGVPFIGVPLQADFHLDVPALVAAMAEHRPALVFLAYPNNPTGRSEDPDCIRHLVAANPGITVVDEAYAPFADHSFLPEAGVLPGLLVLRTLSKLGLAGLRLGYLAAAPEWINALDRLRLPYNINTLTQVSARFALEHQTVLTAQAQVLRHERECLAVALAACPGVREVVPSSANFLLFRVPPGQGTGTFHALRQAGILIRDVGRSGGLLADCLRVTVGTAAENARFLAALTRILAASAIEPPSAVAPPGA
jgi:histidinol-phosphate aminotransferase